MLLRRTGGLVVLIVITHALAACGHSESTKVQSAEEKATSAADRASGAPEANRPYGLQQANAAGGPEAQEEFWLGKPREDLDRFFGVYGDSDNPGRDFFVTEAKRPKWAEQAPEIPRGYLMMGATWGDASNWYMKAVSETRFEQQTAGDFAPPEPIVVVFETDDDGKAIAIRFETVFADRGRIARLKDLPEGW